MTSSCSTIALAAVGIVHFVDRLYELADVFKALVDRGKAHIGHLVQLLELGHDQLAYGLGGDFALASQLKFFFDTLYSGIDLSHGDGTLAQCNAHARPQTCGIKIHTSAI